MYFWWFSLNEDEKDWKRGYVSMPGEWEKNDCYGYLYFTNGEFALAEIQDRGN